jgi:hypothetical protein
MRKANWMWQPHAGHYILGDKCKFVLNTYVGGYIVSTIGELWQDQSSRRIHTNIHNNIYKTTWYAENKHLMGDNFDAAYFKEYGYSEIGAGRKYETMVFKAKKSSHGCCPWEMVSGEEIDFRHHDTAEEARKGHMELCEKWAKENERPKPLPNQTDIVEELEKKA